MVGLTISLEQFRLGQNQGVISFEGFRGFIDMLRFVGQITVDYEGGDTFTLNVANATRAKLIVSRFESFGIKVDIE